jgi:purine nucleoside phosphorylase
VNVLAILTDTPQDGKTHDTPYGASAPIRQHDLGEQTALVCAQGYADPRATVRALKDLGAAHLWLCESVGALSPLLETGDWLVPDDYIDGTRGQHYTYFSEKAGGYVQQVPPFDPESREALLKVLSEKSEHSHSDKPSQRGRVFRRGVYVCVSNTRLETPAEAAFWTRAGGHLVGRFLSPCLTLARELDIKVAALVTVTRAGGETGTTLPFETYVPVISAACVLLNSKT